jgi:hypothetical protein
MSNVKEIVIRLKTENAAFEDDLAGEVLQILRNRIAYVLPTAMAGDTFSLFDSNGNRCGSIEIG